MYFRIRSIPTDILPRPANHISLRIQLALTMMSSPPTGMFACFVSLYLLALSSASFEGLYNTNFLAYKAIYEHTHKSFLPVLICVLSAGPSWPEPSGTGQPDCRQMWCHYICVSHLHKQYILLGLKGFLPFWIPGINRDNLIWHIFGHESICPQKYASQNESDSVVWREIYSCWVYNISSQIFLHWSSHICQSPNLSEFPHFS